MADAQSFGVSYTGGLCALVTCFQRAQVVHRVIGYQSRGQALFRVTHVKKTLATGDDMAIGYQKILVYDHAAAARHDLTGAVYRLHCDHAAGCQLVYEFRSQRRASTRKQKSHAQPRCTYQQGCAGIFTTHLCPMRNQLQQRWTLSHLMTRFAIAAG